MGLRFGVLGPLEVRGDATIEVARPSHRRLLSILLLAGQKRLPTDILIDRFWGGEPPERAKAAMQTHVSDLRRLLPDGLIVTEGYGYRLVLEGHTLDADTFVTQADEVRRRRREERWEEALSAAQDALALWRARPYPELEDDTSAHPEIARLEELHVELLGHRVEALIAAGRCEDALPELERLVADHPLHERFWEQLMLARYRLGRHADALSAYREIHGALAEHGLETGHGLRELERRILQHDTRLVDTSPPTNLPVRSDRFVGRDREVAELGSLISRHQLVTLTGVGGTGKTRLAQQVAATSVDAYPDGCWVVELAAVRDPELLPSVAAAALGLRPDVDDAMAAIRAAVADADVLVVLDNCEHLRDAAAQLAHALVTSGSDVRVLATSRTSLDAPGEFVFETPPMGLPSADDIDAATLRECDAARLFEDRAAALRPGYRICDTDAAAVAEICRRLDGVPLAIELAAARVRTLGTCEIAERLDDRFRLLTVGRATAPARHRTLGAAVRWSYDLLDEPARELFARLSVFRGGFDLAMVEDIAALPGLDRGEVVDRLSELVGQSLVAEVGETTTSRRYRLLETLRAFAHERLQESGQADEVRARHRTWCAALAAAFWGERHSSGDADRATRLAQESDNLQAALDRTLADRTPGDPDAEVETLAAALSWRWDAAGHGQLAASYLELALDACADPIREAELRAYLANGRFGAGQIEAALTEVERAVELVGDGPPSHAKLAAVSTYARLHLLMVDQDPQAAIVPAREAVAVAAALGDAVAEVRARSTLASALAWNGKVDEGLREQLAALDLAFDVGDDGLIVRVANATFDVLVLHPTERRDGPRRLTEQLLSRFADGDRPWVTLAHRGLDYLAYVFLQTGEWDRAEEVIDALGARHREGFERTWHLMTRATLRWMQGRLDDARADLRSLQQLGINPRWYHDYFPLRAEVAADGGDLDEVLVAADRYLEVDVDPSEQAKKLGVLVPAIRARVDAALAATGEARDELQRRIDADLATMRHRLETYPPPQDGSLQLETHTTYLAFAEAERSRLSAPDPDRWREAVERSDHAYSRLYAGWRLAETLAATGRPRDAGRELRERHRDAQRFGAERLRHELEALATRLDLELEAVPGPSAAATR